MSKKFSLGPIMRKVSPVLLLSVFLLPISARAEIKAGGVELSPFAGYNFFEHRQNLENSPVFGGRIGYDITNHIGIEATGQFTRSKVDDRSKSFTREGEFTSPIHDVDISMYHLDLLYHFMPEGKFNPFVTAGYGIAHYSPKINTKEVMSLVDFGVGAKYWVAENVALRIDVRDNLIYDDQIHNIETTAGVVFRFGGTSNAAKQTTAEAAPVQEAQAAQPLDSDHDGVPDSLDRCPGTPGGVAVDAKGCPVDSDGDGVPDYLDTCPNTPSGVKVDGKGCPIDSDGDGVPDYLDKCPNTPAGVPVDSKGCPIAVQASPAAVQPKVMVLSFEDVHFDFNQSSLKPEAKAILKRNIELLNENPHAQIRIAGYTSASGTEEYNQKLSERRATSVREYLVSEGLIEPARLSTIGYGETHPAAFEAHPKELNSPAAKANIRVLFEITVQ
jgi:OmpA-OmpF porin, OOP family